MYDEMKDFQLKYWNEYLFYEKEFVNINDYIHLDKKNFNTYSFKLVELLIGICSAIDRMFRKYTNTNEQYCSIGNYKEIIMNDNQDFYKIEVNLINNDEIVLCPFDNWEPGKEKSSLKFWEAYTNVKHNKNDGIINATFESVMNSLSALYIMNVKYMDKIYNSNDNIYKNYPENDSVLFYIKGHEKRIRNDLLNTKINIIKDDNETVFLENP